MNMTNMPAEPLIFQSGTQSAGLELVNIYFWIFRQFMEEKELTKPLARLVYTNLKTARTDSVFLQSVGKRFEASFEN
ncbi:hypothetical protein CJ889_004508 [Salmonella enterica subsp. enterica serovar Enteritidis]|nr:hypothetical protein [Salmonella enterica subsp. enterica serovar Enteritidis]EGX0716571.1 hypothetical protein [Salmonella enterica subsp. enterica serovar Enteritidis]